MRVVEWLVIRVCSIRWESYMVREKARYQA